MALKDGKGFNVPNSNVPGFLSKLWLLVDDAENEELIGWSASGNSFIVQDQTRFAKEILPNYFKHNNMASFIRQLNMYGFRKKASLDHGTLKAERDDIEFQHPNFKKGKLDQLELIKRKVSAREESKLRLDDMQRILSDVQEMKGKQDNISGTLEGIQRENQVLWREVVFLRQRHEKQQKIVNRLIQFLITMVKPVGLKRKQQLMLEPASGDSKSKYSRLPPSSDTRQFMGQQPTTYDTDIDNLPGLSHTGAVLADVTEVPMDTFQPAPGNDGDSSETASSFSLSQGQLDPSLYNLELPPMPSDDITSPVVASVEPSSIEPTNIPDLELSSGMGDATWFESNSTSMPSFPIVGEENQVGSSFGPDVGPVSMVGDVSKTISNSDSRVLVKRMVSHDEQRGEIGEHVSTVQDNLDMIQHMLTSIGPPGAYNLDMDSLLEIFNNSDNSGITTETDLFPALNENISPIPYNLDANTTGTEMVQYVSPLVDDDDEDSLLMSLTDDSNALQKLSTSDNTVD